MDHNQLLDRLLALVPAQFAELVFRLGVPPHLLPEAAPSKVAIAVIQYMVQQARLHELEAYLVHGPAAPVQTARDARGAAGPPPMEVKIELPAASAPMEVQIKILFLGANPSDKVHIALDREVRAIGDNLRESDGGKRFVLIQEWAVQATDLQKLLLRHRPHIVHFSGHGSNAGELGFEDAASKAQAVSIPAIANLFGLLGAGIQCVVLNACYSQRQAEAIRQHVDCVIGMSDAIPNKAAVAFASSFYLALGHGQSVKAAAGLGANQIELIGVHGDHLPVLLFRDGVDPAAVRVGLDCDKPRA
jgi:hypothetical protein